MTSSPTPPSAPQTSKPTGITPARVLITLVGMGLLTVAILGVLIITTLPGRVPALPSATTTTAEVRPTPNVLVAMKQLARLETMRFHMERVVDLTDKQTHLWGLIEAKDALLLLAVGDVVAGVDLNKMTEGDVTSSFTDKKVRVRLPPPEVFAATLDPAKTRVYTRTTDVLASRHEDLEGRARQEAAASMERAAKEEGLLDRSRVGAEHAVRALLTASGFEQIEIEWRAE